MSGLSLECDTNKRTLEVRSTGANVSGMKKNPIIVCGRIVSAWNENIVRKRRTIT